MLGELIDLISGIALGEEGSRSRDILGRVYEYFLGQFAGAEGKRGGEFYTPRSVVRVLVEMLEPYRPRLRPLLRLRRHVRAVGKVRAGARRPHRRHRHLRQESNYTTWRLCKMNLAVRGIDADIRWNNEGSFHKDELRDLKFRLHPRQPAVQRLRLGRRAPARDVRWQFGVPPVGNANYAWIQHIYHHLRPPTAPRAWCWPTAP
jgi:Type I restriction-modification system methyltransferase subunit